MIKVHVYPIHSDEIANGLITSDQLRELMALLKLTIRHVRWAVFVMFFAMLFKVLLEAGDVVWYLGLVDGSICGSLLAIFAYLSILEDRL